MKTLSFKVLAVLPVIAAVAVAVAFEGVCVTTTLSVRTEAGVGSTKETFWVLAPVKVIVDGGFVVISVQDHAKSDDTTVTLEVNWGDTVSWIPARTVWGDTVTLSETPVVGAE